MPTIELLVGMIASGKSTYAFKRAKEGALIVSHDALTAMLHAEYRYEQELRTCYRDMEDWLVRVALAHGKDVVVDRTHLTAESRRRWILFGKTLDVGADLIAVAFPIRSPREHAYDRHEHDARGRTFAKWLEVAEHHAAQAAAEPLSADEGFAAIGRIEGGPHAG